MAKRLKEIKVEVIGLEPPCPECKKAMKNAERVAVKLRQKGLVVTVEKLNSISKEARSKYGIIMFIPAVAINGTVRIMGRVPSEGEMERILKEVASQ